MSIAETVADKNIRVAVLCGGPGGERDVSLASGENVHQALLSAGVKHELVVVPAGDPERFLRELSCDLAVMMLHGHFGEDGVAQRILEERRIAFTGSDSDACALAMDKNRTKELLREHGIATPRWLVTSSPREAAAEVGLVGLKYPLFVKPNSSGSSVGVSKVESPELLIEAVTLALADDPLAMVEEMVVGDELTTGWLDGRVLPTIQMEADGVFYDYRAKYVSEKTRYVCPANLPEKTAEAVDEFAATAARLVGARDVARVDLMLGVEGPMVLEVNMLPGFTAHSLLPMAAAAAGMRLEELCVSLVAMAAARAGIV